MSNTKQDITRRILELGDSGLEALEYVYDVTKEGNSELTHQVMSGLIEAFISIEESLPYVLDMGNEIMAWSRQLKNDLEHLVTCYESGKEADILLALEGKVIPSYAKWLESLKASLTLQS
jgi:hypothetical protein